MLPIFPNISRLKLHHQNDIEKHIVQFHPYSDYNFTSMWAYNTEEIIEVFWLNKNLVVMFQDYIDSKPFYSFLGTNQINKTIESLLNLSNQNNLPLKLKLIPEVVVKHKEKVTDIFSVKEDPDNFDYILSVQEIAELKGKKYYDKRNLINRFKRLYSGYVVKNIDLNNKSIQKEIFELFLLWSTQAKRTQEDYQTELEAIKRFLTFANQLHFYGIGIYFKNKMIGFSTYELIHADYSIMSFEKGDRTFEGIYSVLNNEVAKHLSILKKKYINYEQDLGIPGLKKAKSLWRPIFYLKKYIISAK